MTDTPAEREDQSIWARLRRRKVVQWSVAYVAAAWALLQGLEFLADIYDWPTAFLRVVTLALALGLPIVVTLAWYHGDRGEQRAGGTELSIVAVLFLLSGGVVWYYQRTADTTTVATPVPAIEKAIPTDASIAVLPFVNMSPDKEQEYFADGISEELMNLLAQVPDLRVIARTSSFSFKGKEVEIAEIARRLDVAHVLEGSVRRSGDKVRISAQLDPRVRQFAPVVADLRAADDRCIRRAGPDCCSGGFGTQDEIPRRNTKGKDNGPKSLHAVLAGPPDWTSVHEWQFRAVEGAHQQALESRSWVCGGVGGFGYATTGTGNHGSGTDRPEHPASARSDEEGTRSNRPSQAHTSD